MIDTASVPTAGNLAAKSKEPTLTPDALHALILQSLDDDQAQEVVTIPLEGKSSIADHMVIASGRSTRQVASMAQKLAEEIKKYRLANENETEFDYKVTPTPTSDPEKTEIIRINNIELIYLYIFLPPLKTSFKINLSAKNFSFFYFFFEASIGF